MLVHVLVGWTSSRPVIPDEHTHLIVVDCPTETAATLLAAQWVAHRPGCQMPTSTKVLRIEP